MKSFILILLCLKFSLQVPLKDLKEEERIFRGKLAKNGEYPWMVYLDSSKDLCGGVLISKNFVLTSGHCMYDRRRSKFVSPEKVTVKVGDVFLSKAKSIRVSEIYTYDDYDDNDYDHALNDIAILKLQTAAPIDNNLKTICLTDSGYNLEDQTPVIQLGWGEFDKGSNMSETLKVTNKSFYLNNVTCHRVTEKWTYRGFLCVASKTFHGERSCRGDSGGPMVITKGNQKISAGVVSYSFGDDCVMDMAMAIMFTDIREHAEWIKTQTKDNTICWVQN